MISRRVVLYFFLFLFQVVNSVGQLINKLEAFLFVVDHQYSPLIASNYIVLTNKLTIS